MKREILHDGREDGLSPLQSLDLGQVKTFADLLRAMSRTAFSGRQLGEAFEIVLEMARDPDCRVVLTVSGAMTVAKQGRIICDMIDHHLVDAVVATGALIAHGLTESMGLTHYRHDPTIPDVTLFERGYNRVHDTLEMEANLNGVETLVRSVLDDETPADGIWSSARICRALGRRLSELGQGPGVLRSAYEQEVPVFIPAMTDSELGLDFATWAMSRALGGRRQQAGVQDPQRVFQAVPNFNPFLDLQHYARWAGEAPCLGVFTIGGGVPRNWAQQVAPYYDIASERLELELPSPRFRYAVRICPEPVHWGGLSGCTYAEGVSWGKFLPASEGGRYAEVYADATLVWPLLIKAVLEELQTSAKES
ncbi:MAG: deoxyhypusine synthase family protein [Pirellulaceae bacterium]